MSRDFVTLQSLNARSGKRDSRCTLMKREPKLRANFLHRFDSDGSPIVIGQTTLTSKGTVPKEYQTPYGAMTVERHVYQSSRVRQDMNVPWNDPHGWSPVPHRDLLLLLSHKYAEGSAGRVVEV